MIRINDELINIGHYPDGTLNIKYLVDSNIYDNFNILWLYDGEEELIALIYLVSHIREHKYDANISLYMPYLPNARMDRVLNQQDIFSFKHFSNIINSLDFSKVRVLDPHSTVNEGLINRFYIENPSHYINLVMRELHIHSSKNITLFYPDAGAMKRYSKIVKVPYVFGNKTRDWETGEIQGLEVIGNLNLVKDHDILIVDDICSRGGTFYYAAKRLKELGAFNIYLWVSHCENTVLDGDLIKSGLVKKIYTTDSVYTAKHDLIQVVTKFRKGE